MENEILKTVSEIMGGRKIAVGNDLVFLPDFKLSFNDLFKNKVYTQTEIDYCEQFDDPLLRYASTWAAKEAVYKAVKQIDRAAIGPKKIEIVRKKNAGEPVVIIHKEKVDFDISLSISHDGDYVWAVALLENNK